MRTVLIGTAAIALVAGTAYADPGKGGGDDKGAQGKGAAMSQGGGSQGVAKKGGGNNDAGPSMKAAKVDRGPDIKAARPDRGPSMKAAKADDRPDKGPAMRAGNQGNRSVEKGVKRNGEQRVQRDGRIDRGNDVRVVRTVSFDDRGTRGLINGCPPGLAKKRNGCTPPGLAKDRNYDWRSSYYQPSWWGHDRVGDGRYFYDDGYLYRINSGGSVLGYIPLLGGALSVGNPWPSYYQPVSVPQYYVDYYNLGPSNNYRYADDVLYRVDPQTSAITSIAALLTGDQFSVGQPIPSGYDVYNVPYGFRDQYYDTPASNYRYSDGYVYQVDPTTQLIQAAIQLLV